jgi:hypothetical protein
MGRQTTTTLSSSKLLGMGQPPNAKLAWFVPALLTLYSSLTIIMAQVLTIGGKYEDLSNQFLLASITPLLTLTGVQRCAFDVYKVE